MTVLILAAGRGKRMKSKWAKVIHPIAGRPMVTYLIERGRELGSHKIVVVVGHQSQHVKEVLAPYGVEVVVQDPPRGTGDAVLQSRSAISGVDGPILILNGDAPLITIETLKQLIQTHQTEKATLTLLSALVESPTGYGRLIRSGNGGVLSVVEEKDANASQKTIREINTGFYVVDRDFLFETVGNLCADNQQGEYYLTDMIEAAIKQKLGVGVMRLEEKTEEILGINTRMDLAKLEKIMRRRILSEHLRNGVTLVDPETTWIDPGVSIGQDTVIYPQVQIEGKSRIGEDCVIRSHSRLTDCQVGIGVVVKDSCVITESVLEDGVSIGPFAHLRPGTVLRKGAKIGNFVEAKNAEIGEGSKANHLSYLGDATIGRNVNIGAGTITCNYDGNHKHSTVIEDEVFVGSDTQFVAPVHVSKGAVIGAGSTITEDVPPESLALSRCRQINKPGWVKRRREVRQSRSSSLRKKGKFK